MDQRIRNIIIIIGVVLLLFLLYYFINIVSYILIAAALSLIGRPIEKSISRVHIGKFKVSKTISAILTLLILCSVMLGFFWFFIPLVASEVSHLSDINVQDIGNYIDNAIDQLRINSPRLAWIFPAKGNVNNYMQTEFANLLNISQVSNVFNSVASAVGNLFLMFFAVSFILFFFLKRREFIWQPDLSIGTH